MNEIFDIPKGAFSPQDSTCQDGEEKNECFLFRGLVRSESRIFFVIGLPGRTLENQEETTKEAKTHDHQASHATKGPATGGPDWRPHLVPAISCFHHHQATVRKFFIRLFKGMKHFSLVLDMLLLIIQDLLNLLICTLSENEMKIDHALCRNDMGRRSSSEVMSRRKSG